MSYFEMATQLLGPVALLKYRSTRAAHNIADDASQIFGKSKNGATLCTMLMLFYSCIGGRAITKTGMGKNVEAFHRTYKFAVSWNNTHAVAFWEQLTYFPATDIFPNVTRPFWVAVKKSWPIWVSIKLCASSPRIRNCSLEVPWFFLMLWIALCCSF